MTKKWIVSWRFNGFVYSKSFVEYSKVLAFYNIQQENGYDPSIHEE